MPKGSAHSLGEKAYTFPRFPNSGNMIEKPRGGCAVCSQGGIDKQITKPDTQALSKALSREGGDHVSPRKNRD